MKKTWICLFASVLLASLGSGLTPQSASDLFQKALTKEKAEGNLEEAIALFQQVVDKGGDEALAAQAQLHIGICYEKLGLGKARESYQKVIDRYPRQAEAVKAAKEKLSLLLRADTITGKGNKEFNIRKVGDVGAGGAISPDGRYLSCQDGNTGDLAIYEIATGNKRRLTNKGSWDESGEFASYSRWSPDGKQIVYDWYNKNDYNDLCIVGLDGSKPRILYSNKEVTWTSTFGWSPDGKQILARFERKDGQYQIVLVSTADGSLRVLKTMDKGRPDHLNFSPDGRYIVYDFPQREDSLERDISLLSTDGSREIPLVEHPANDYVLGWAPDGKNILFASDRRNSLDVWVIQFLDGKVQETPKLLKSNIGNVCLPMGFTQKGSFCCYLYDVTRVIYFAELDPETGKMPAPPQKASARFEGSLTQPEYSPDGISIAYISKEASALSIQSLETGKMQEFSSRLIHGFTSPRWSPDGRSILVEGRDRKGKQGIYRMDTQSGIFTLMVPFAEHFLSAYEWSRDGKAIFLVRLANKQTLSQVMLREIESGKEKELYRESADMLYFKLSCSPDGKWLAFLISKKGKESERLTGEPRVLGIMPAAGGEVRELYRFKKEDIPYGIRWTPDGNHILLNSIQFAEKKFSLWRIPIAGGEPQKLGFESDSSISIVSVHPDGRHIAFSSGDSKGENSGNWVMENFQPPNKK